MARIVVSAGTVAYDTHIKSGAATDRSKQGVVQLSVFFLPARCTFERSKYRDCWARAVFTPSLLPPTTPQELSPQQADDASSRGIRHSHLASLPVSSHSSIPVQSSRRRLLERPTNHLPLDVGVVMNRLSLSCFHTKGKQPSGLCAKFRDCRRVVGT